MFSPSQGLGLVLRGAELLPGIGIQTTALHDPVALLSAIEADMVVLATLASAAAEG